LCKFITYSFQTTNKKRNIYTELQINNQQVAQLSHRDRVAGLVTVAGEEGMLNRKAAQSPR